MDIYYEINNMAVVDVITSFGPDEGTLCNVYGKANCLDVEWPFDYKRTPDDSFGFPGTDDPVYNAMSFKCWKV